MAALNSSKGTLGRKIACIGLCVFYLGNASADAIADAEQVIVKNLAAKVRVIKKPFYLWSWFNSDGRDPIWKSAFSADSKAGYDHFVDGAGRYWTSYCSTDRTLKNPADCPDNKAIQDRIKYGGTNLYGPGLYFAIDPVVTAGFGGSPDKWDLLQVTVPVGMRLAILQNDGLDSETVRALKTLKCNTGPSLTSADQLFALNNAMTSPACKLEMRTIFKDMLQIDGFAFAYPSTYIKGCQNSVSNHAIVLTNTSKIMPTDVRVFNPQTPDASEDRIGIQSLFYLADIQEHSATAMLYYRGLMAKGASVPEFLGRDKVLTYNELGNCQDSTCSPTLTDCKLDGSCISVDLPKSVPPPIFRSEMPVVIQADSVPDTLSFIWKSGNTPVGLLWTDLDQRPTTPNLQDWLPNHLIDCQADSLFDSSGGG